ncbi:MAG: glycosyltransferase family 39 protein [Candidatus Methanomethylicaceae archaeon]
MLEAIVKQIREKRTSSLFIAISSLALILFVLTITSAILFPYSLDYGEAPLIDQAKRFVAGKEIYKADLNRPPYVIANYPPIYPLLIALIGSISRLPFLAVGRMISAFAALISAIFIGRFSYQLSGSRFSGLVAMVLFLSNLFVMSWSFRARVDMLALAFSLACLWIMYRYWNSWRWLALAVGFMVMAIYTRQSYVLAVPAAGIVWLWQKDRWRALVFVGSLALTTFMIFLMLNILTRGGFFLHTIVANINPYSLERVADFAVLLILAWPFALAIVVIQIKQAVKVMLNRRDSLTELDPFLVYGLPVYSVGAFLSALTVGKVGSHVNYLLELVASCTIWATSARISPPRPLPLRYQGLTLLFLSQLAWSLGSNFPVYRSLIYSHWQDLPQYERLFQAVRSAAKQGPVLADDGLYMVILAEQPIYYQPFEYSQLYIQGIWNPSLLIEEIKAHKFALIVLNMTDPALYQERWAKPIATAIENSYVKSGTLLEFTLYMAPTTGLPPK